MSFEKLFKMTDLSLIFQTYVLEEKLKLHDLGHHLCEKPLGLHFAKMYLFLWFLIGKILLGGEWHRVSSLCLGD